MLAIPAQMFSLCLGLYLTHPVTVPSFLSCFGYSVSFRLLRLLTCQYLLPSLKPWLCHTFCPVSGLQQQLAEAAWGSALQGMLTQLTYTTGTP